jgi:spermidine/putrescine transport system permease protein
MRALVAARRWRPWRAAADAASARPALRLAVLAAIPMLWIVGANLAPLAQMAAISLMERYPVPPGEPVAWTLSHYAAFWERSLYLNAYIRSFIFATAVTLITLLVMFPVAWYVAKVAPREARLRLLLILVAPFWVSEIVRSIAWMLVLANRGALNLALAGVGVIDDPLPMLYTHGSLAVGVLYLTSLYMLLPLYAAFEKIDDGLLQASANLGAGPLTRLRRIILPLARDGIVGGCTLVFLMAIGLYAMPQLLGGPDTTLFAVTIGQVFSRAGDAWPLGSALSILLILGALGWVGAFALLWKSPRRSA